MKKIYTHKNSWFSIIEVMIGIFVFSLGLTSIFMMMSWSVNMSSYSRNLIIASQLASEQVELFKNIRDSNYNVWKSWDILDPSWVYAASTVKFESWKYYTLENNYNPDARFPIYVAQLLQLPPEDQDEIFDDIASHSAYRLYLSDEWRYTHDSSWQETNFFRYVYLEPASYFENGNEVVVDDAFKLTSKVIWADKWIHSTSVDTVITDWKRY